MQALTIFALLGTVSGRHDGVGTQCTYSPWGVRVYNSSFLGCLVNQQVHVVVIACREKVDGHVTQVFNSGSAVASHGNRACAETGSSQGERQALVRSLS